MIAVRDNVLFVLMLAVPLLEWIWISEDNSWTDRWSGEPFGQGDHRRAQNVIQGQRNGRPIVAFDYSYQTHTTDAQGGRPPQLIGTACARSACPPRHLVCR